MTDFTALTPGRLLAGDYIVSGPYAGAWMQGTRVVQSVKHAEAPAHFVITFTDGETTIAHKSAFVHIRRTQ